MNGKPIEVGYQATCLWRYLWREKIGPLPAQSLNTEGDINATLPTVNPENNIYDNNESWKFVEDPLSDELWEAWTSQAEKNTEIFQQVFHADPDDHGK